MTRFARALLYYLPVSQHGVLRKALTGMSDVQESTDQGTNATFVPFFSPHAHH